MILVLDNHDSFTFNLVHYLVELGADVQVVRADAITAADAMASGARAFLISPGPGRPEEAGSSMDLVQACVETRRPLLGVCLGHQAIGAWFGSTVERGPAPVHGKTSAITHDGSGLFTGLPSPFQAARYHSLVVDAASLPDVLVVNATTEDGSIQGLRHRDLPIHGVQFHPESIATRHGHDLLGNFLALSEGHAGQKQGSG